VLTPFHRVLDVKDIKVGRDGLLMIQGQSEGLLLPQVATEQGFDRKTFLEETCRKAGLPRAAWQDENTDIFAFSALVFNERNSSESVTSEPVSFQTPTRSPAALAPSSLHP